MLRFFVFCFWFFFFFFNDTATTEIYTLSLHDALPISLLDAGLVEQVDARLGDDVGHRSPPRCGPGPSRGASLRPSISTAVRVVLLGVRLGCPCRSTKRSPASVAGCPSAGSWVLETASRCSPTSWGFSRRPTRRWSCGAPTARRCRSRAPRSWPRSWYPLPAFASPTAT